VSQEKKVVTSFNTNFFSKEANILIVTELNKANEWPVLRKIIEVVQLIIHSSHSHVIKDDTLAAHVIGKERKLRI